MNNESRDDVLITGWGHTQFGRREEDLEGLIGQAIQEAIRSAGLEASDIDEVWLGNFNAGLQAFASPASLVLGADEALWGVPVTRVETACASGSSAFHAGWQSRDRKVKPMIPLVG